MMARNFSSVARKASTEKIGHQSVNPRTHLRLARVHLATHEQLHDVGIKGLRRTACLMLGTNLPGQLANRRRTADTPNRAAQGQSVSRKTVAEVPLTGLSLPKIPFGLIASQASGTVEDARELIAGGKLVALGSTDGDLTKLDIQDCRDGFDTGFDREPSLPKKNDPAMCQLLAIDQFTESGHGESAPSP